MNKQEMNTTLEEIGLSPAEIAVYVSLCDGAESVREIIKMTSEKRPTIYYSLNSLEKRGLVSKTGKEYGNKFQVEPVEKLVELVQRNIRKQNELLEKTKKLKDFYPRNKTHAKVLVSYFDSIEAITSAIFYSVYGKGKTIRTIVPAQNFFQEMGKEFIEEYVKEKNKRNIKTIALWEDIPKKGIIKEYYAHALIKQMPLDMHNSFETTVFMYDDKTLYVSPKREQYAVLIQSAEHSKMMRSLFDTTWRSAIDIS